MRKLIAVVAALAALAPFVPACSSSSTPPDDTCAFIGDPNNCYRRMLPLIDDCLTDEGGDGGTSPQGTFGPDGVTCTYPTGRVVKFASDPRKAPDQNPPVDVTVTVGGKTCVHYVDVPKSSITITQPDGKQLTASVSGNGETITCPDGTQHYIDVQTLFNGCGDAGGILSGGLPGVVMVNGQTSVSGSLLGMKKQAYSCSSTK